MRIALVDDSEIERGILLSLITDYGCEKQILFESDCFDSGDAFLSSFSSDKYDIVFMDIFMNGMSGVETASKMRQIDNHVILIFLTASAVTARCLSCPCISLYSKTISERCDFCMSE